jgi:hypothetical protein
MPSNRLVNASQAVRCQHIKVNGSGCGSPARHGRRFCCFHDSAVRRNREFVLPVIEDAASLQLALNKIMQALVDKLIDQKTTSTLLYGLQIASANLKRLDKEQFRDKLDRMARARRDQEQQQSASVGRVAHAPSRVHPCPTESDANRQPQIGNDSEHPITGSPDHPIAVRQRQTADGPLPPASAPASPVEDFLRKIANQKSQLTNDPDRQITRSPDHPMKDRFDINACADEVPCLRGSVVSWPKSEPQNGFASPEISDFFRLPPPHVHLQPLFTSSLACPARSHEK